MIRYVPASPLSDAVKEWTGRPFPEFPTDKPPCGEIPGAIDENRELAHAFALLCSEPLNNERTGKVAFLAGLIIKSERHLKLAWDATHGMGDSRKVGTMDRSGWSRMKPYEAMVDALKAWLVELHEDLVANIEVGFLDDAARRTA